MKSTKKVFSLLTLILLIFSIIVASIPQASATTICTWSQTTGVGAYFNGIYALYEGNKDTGDAVGDNFSPNYAGYLKSIDVKMIKVGSPVFTINMGIEEVANSTSVPTGTPTKISSSTYAAANIETSYMFYSFSFDQTMQLQTGHWYAYYLYVTDFTTGAYNSNWIKVCVTDTNAVSGGVVITENGNWIGSGATDRELIANIYVESSAPTASPAPSTYQYWNGTAWVSYTPATPEPNIFDNGVATPYIQMLVPIIILAAAALLGWKFAGAWGFFAGLNIGAILTYMILGSSVFPLWGIVALLVIDGLLLFGKIGIRS